MKPFDLELAKKGERVITRCGFEALLCGEDNIPRGLSLCDVFPLAVYLYDKYDNLLTCESFTKSGKFCDGDSEFDLFMAEDSDLKSKNERIYYRGDPERGNKIIADLEKRGGRNPHHFSAYSSSSVYFINQFGVISTTGYDSVKDSLNGCTELHLPPKKVKKEGWVNLVDYGLSKRSCIIPSGSIYDSESEAKEAVKRFDSTLKNFKTIKIGWEEEQK